MKCVRGSLDAFIAWRKLHLLSEGSVGSVVSAGSLVSRSERRGVCVARGVRGDGDAGEVSESSSREEHADPDSSAPRSISSSPDPDPSAEPSVSASMPAAACKTRYTSS